MTTFQQGHANGGPDEVDPHQPPSGESSMRRQLVWYVVGLVPVYGAGLAIFWPDEGPTPPACPSSS